MMKIAPRHALIAGIALGLAALIALDQCSMEETLNQYDRSLRGATQSR